MADFRNEVSRFHARKYKENEQASQRATFFILSGIDLDAAFELRGEKKKRLLCRLERFLERERLKGTRRHWSYDLNRHIALKHALDALRSAERSRAIVGNV